MLSDEQLVYEIKNGNEAAMEVLVKRHYNVVFSYIYRKTGDYHIANDLTQEVYIKMMKSIETLYLEQGKFINWLLKIAVNTCRDHYKSKAYKQQNKESILDENLTQSGNIISLLERNEEANKVKKAMLELPEPQREALILKFYHEKKYSEIAQITFSNESTVKSRVRQALGKLKSLIEGSELTDEKREQKLTRL